MPDAKITKPTMRRSRSNLGMPQIAKEHYTGFGMIIQANCGLEIMLDEIIITMTKTAESPAVIPLLTLRSTRDKREYVTAISKDYNWPAYAIKGFDGLM